MPNPASSSPSPTALADWDRRYVWHPFTQMRDWERSTPLIITHAKGPYLYDHEGRRYLDGVSSIWVNLHGHRHPTLDRAIHRQLRQAAHTTLLGLASPPSIRLARELIRRAPTGLTRVFYSDDGSTAMEVALKMALQYWQQCRPAGPRKRTFVHFSQAYHGDTAGAMSIGGIDLFQGRFDALQVRSETVDAPYCYRCPIQKTFPSCALACVAPLEALLTQRHREIAGVVVEPLVQAAAGLITAPLGYLARVRELCTRYNVLLIADEVATGFGRTGTLFACEQENVTPDLMAISKGLTGGYLPLAATLATDTIYDAFLGRYDEFKTFFHGHSYTGNALGCAAALANLDIFRQERTLAGVRQKSRLLSRALRPLADIPVVGDIRQRGMMVGIELVMNRETRAPFPLATQIGHRIAAAARERGMILRPLGHILVLMPPLNTPDRLLSTMVEILADSIRAVTDNLPSRRRTPRTPR
ncbi:MAG: adenosylmethionine--8-amino-7-oxononanoate transaminase [Nitrospiraceae bacterium]